MSELKKVIGFDSWTGGSFNFERLAAACNSRAIDFSVVHVGSWGGDPGRPPEETVGELRYKDIRAFGSNCLREVLLREQPDAVVFLSTDTFAHRAFNRYCRTHNVPTLNLYHGLVSVQHVGDAPMYSVSPFAQLKFVLVRIPKALRYVWPAYAGSLLATRARASDWMRFVRDIVTGAFGRRDARSADDARTDKCCVYIDADIEHAVSRYGFKPSDVIAVGNPDLARFGLNAELVGSQLRRTGTPATEVMYVDTGLVHTGYVFESAAHFLQHLFDTRDGLARQGRRLVLKPHPDHLRTQLPDQLQRGGIEVVANADFVARLQRCDACIVEPSTLAMVPALLGMPLFLAKYGRLEEQRYGDVLTNYPRAMILSDVSKASAMLEAERARFDAALTRDWIDRHTGPLPAADMPRRVLDVIERMMMERRNRADQPS
jgi:hypothetical protein